MDRKEFLSQIGISAVGLIVFSCLGGCEKEGNVPAAPTNVNLNVDLTATANAALLQPGGYIYLDGIIIAKTMNGGYLAVSQACTHQGATVTYQSGTNKFYCSSHGSLFNANGAVANGPASTSLKQYTVTVNGNNLTITG